MKRSLSRTISLSFATVFLLASASLALAWGPGWGGGTMTQEQYAKAQQLAAENYAAINPIFQQWQAKQAELNAQVYRQTPEKTKIEALSKEIGELQGKLYAEQANLEAKLVKEGIPAGNGWCPGYGGGMGRGMMGGGMGCGGGMGRW